MRLLKPFVASLVAMVAVLGSASPALGAPLSFTGPVTEIDGRAPGHIQFPESEAAAAFRPQSPGAKSLMVSNYYIHNLTNQKGLDIRASTQVNAPAWAYQSITIQNSSFQNITRREDLPGGNGLHIDHIRIAGGANSQDVKTNILIQNVTIDGGDALPILITDGMYGTITLRNVIIKNTTLNNVQFKTDNVGSIDKIIIDNCPDLGVALIGRPGSIGEVLVRNSPDIRLGDGINATGRSGATVSFIDAASDSSGSFGADDPMLTSIRITPAIPGGIAFPDTVNLPQSVSVPEPGAVALAAAAIGLLFRRRR